MSLIIPDDYVNDINERLTLYKRIDQLSYQEAITSFREELKDRFGEIPQETKELIETLKLRELAKKIGFEKLIIKQNKLLGKFSTTHSNYYESEAFTRVLRFIQLNKHEVALKEKKEVLLFTAKSINNIKQANSLLFEMAN